MTVKFIILVENVEKIIKDSIRDVVQNGFD